MPGLHIPPRKMLAQERCACATTTGGCHIGGRSVRSGASPAGPGGNTIRTEHRPAGRRHRQLTGPKCRPVRDALLAGRHLPRFHLLLGQPCWLKNGVPEARPLPGATSGVVPGRRPALILPLPVQPAVALETDTDRPGTDLASGPQPSANECAAACQRDGRCRAFTYYQGNCWLKDSVPAAAPLPGATSGVVRR